MKVLFDGRILRQSVVTGVQRYGSEMLKAFNTLGFSPDVAYPPSGNPALHHIWEHTVLPALSGKYDILFCPGNIAPFWKPSSTKLITVLHSISYKAASWSYSRPFRAYYNIFIPRALKISSGVITVSESEKAALQEQFPGQSGKITAIQNGISDIFHGQKIEYNKEEYILYVGSLNPLKNLKRVIEAFESIRDKVRHKLMIVGPDHHVFANTAVSANERIVFVKQTTDDQYLAGLYSKAALFVFPSLYEASPLPPVEAMACGSPVVVSGIPAMRERCGNAALYCDPENSGDIADKMLSVLKDGNLSRSLSDRGKKHAAQYTWGGAAIRTIEFINKIHGKGH